MTKTLSMLEAKRNFLKLIMSTYKKSTANIILNGENLDAFPLRSGRSQGGLLSALLLNIVVEVLASSIWQEKEINLDWKGKDKTLPIYI